MTDSEEDRLYKTIKNSSQEIRNAIARLEEIQTEKDEACIRNLKEIIDDLMANALQKNSKKMIIAHQKYKETLVEILEHLKRREGLLEKFCLEDDDFNENTEKSLQETTLNLIAKRKQ